jgi:hypothetical protein
MYKRPIGLYFCNYRLLIGYLLVITLLFVKQPVMANETIDKASSVCSANYYEVEPNQYFTTLNVKGYQQTTDYTCGPAAIMSLMHWYNILDDLNMNHKTEMKIAKEMGTGDINSFHPGTTPEQMVNWLKNNGFKVTWGTNGSLDLIRDNLKKGIPTIIEWIDWGGHWVVVTGYYAESESPKKGVDTIFFADPAVHWSSINNPDGISSFSAWRFHDMWFDAQYFKPGHLVRNIYITAVPNHQTK